MVSTSRQCEDMEATSRTDQLSERGIGVKWSGNPKSWAWPLPKVTACSKKQNKVSDTDWREIMVSSKHTASKAHNARKQSCTELGRKLKPTAKHLKQGRKREHPIHSHTHTHTYIQNPLKDKGSQRRAEADDECVYLLDVCAAQNVAVCQALQAGTDTETEPKKKWARETVAVVFVCLCAGSCTVK